MEYYVSLKKKRWGSLFIDLEGYFVKYKKQSADFF